MVAASIAMLAALVAAYARHALIDSDQFANRASAALRDDSVRTLVAERITDQVAGTDSNLIAARPIIESVAADVVGSSAFTGLFGSAVRDVHRAVFQRDQNTLTLTVADVGTVLGAALEQVRPSLAAEVERTARVSLITRDIGSASATAARIADDVRLLSLLLTLIARAIAVAPDRRRAVVELGIGAACAGVLLVVALAITKSIAVGRLEKPD